MAIYVPGKRSRKGLKVGGAKRNVVAVLQLTAMVDMFTVLVVFLLQNYASTNQILPISEQIALPQATAVKELKPSLTVVLSKEYLSFNDKKISAFQDIQQYRNWLINPLLDIVKQEVQEYEAKAKEQVSTNKPSKIPRHYKMTLQVDKDIDFLSVKKVLYTLTQAGIKEVNFAVIKVKKEDKYHLL